MKKILASIALLASAPAWATMWCGTVNVAGTATPACAAVNPAGQVVVQPRNAADISQHYIVTPDGRVRSAVDGRCIGSRSATVTNPPEVVQARACSTLVTGDRWTFARQAGASVHQTKSQLGSLLAGATSDSPAAGSAVTMWTADGSAAQNWRFVDLPIPARTTDTTVRTLTVQAGLLKYDGLTVSASTELDCTAPLGRYCKVPGTSRYVRALLAAPGVTATEIAAIQYQTTQVAVTVTTPATISGSAIDGQTLTGTPATFANCGSGTVNEWLKSGSVIATGTSYTLGSGDIGASIVFRSTACSVASSSTSSAVAAAGGGGNTNTVAFFSVDQPAGKDPTTNPHWGPYDQRTVNGLNCVNNIWAFVGTTFAARQSLGCQAGSNGGVDWRMKITSPQDATKEVVGYPEILLGKTPSGTPATTDTRLPRAIADVTSATISYQSAAGSLTKGQLVTDVYITKTLGCAGVPCRDTEIMVQLWQFGAYNTPAPWSSCGANRTPENQGAGPNENATKYCDVTIAGVVYDIYNYNPGDWDGKQNNLADSWRLVKVFPKVIPKGAGATVNFKAIVDYLITRGVFPSAGRYYGALELGVEPIVDTGAITGDITVRGVRLDVTVAGQAAYSLPTNTAAFSGNTSSGPIVATTGQVIEGKKISNPTGACITVPDGVHGVVIRNNDIGPCGETTSSATLSDWANDVGVLIAGYDVLIGGNTIHDVRAGVYAQGAEHPIVVDRNLVWGIRGPEPRGEMVQLNTVVATGAAPYTATGGAQTKITNNVSDKTLSVDTGYRNPETKANLLNRITGYVDHVNLYGSSGTSTTPIRVACNKFRGGDDVSGSGMIVGDNGGGWVIAEDNIMVMTTNVGGVGCAGCTDTIVRRNVVYAPGADSASNTSGAFYSKTDDGAFASARVQFLNNRAWVRSWLYGGTGELSAAWYEDGTTTGLTLTGNNFQDATLTAAIWDTTPAACPAT